MTNPTVRKIVAEYLRAHGYDGLCGESCGCWTNDLMPCGEGYADCQAGYKQYAGPNQNDYDEGDLIIGPNKPEAQP